MKIVCKICHFIFSRHALHFTSSIVPKLMAVLQFLGVLVMDGIPFKDASKTPCCFDYIGLSPHTACICTAFVRLLVFRIVCPLFDLLSNDETHWTMPISFYRPYSFSFLDTASRKQMRQARQTTRKQVYNTHATCKQGKHHKILCTLWFKVSLLD